MMNCGDSRVKSEIKRYDDLYSGSPYVRGTAPTDFALTAASWATGMDVLDLGCGEGQDAVAFARKGFGITAIDASPSAIAHAEVLAVGQEVKVCFQCVDAFSFLARPNSYDLIYADAFLHFFDSAGLVNVVGLIQERTRSGGVNAIGVFDGRTTDKESQSLKEWGIRIGTDIEIRSLYANWQNLAENLFLSTRENGELRGITQLVYRKPM